jgi:hypothetical protein
MKKSLALLGILLLAPLPALSAKSLVIFNRGTDTVRSLANLDSVKFTGTSPAFNFVMHKGGATFPVGFSNIDSIRFYDGIAVFSPEMLFNAYQASPMALAPGKAYVTLDLRNLSSNFTGEIITDAIDFLDTANGGVTVLAGLSNVTVRTQSTVPAGASITLYYKTGSTFFTETGWTSWTQAPATSCDLISLAGRYMKIRFVLTTNSKSSLPQISRVALYANYAGLPIFASPVTAASYQNERIVTSPLTFGYETRDNAAVKTFTTNNNLASVIAAKTDEFDKFYALADWTARRNNDRNYSWNPYPWDITQVFLSNGSVRGHCMSYAEVFITGLTGLGYYARHWAIEGYCPDGPEPLSYNHEVAEVWSNKYKKWVYIDATLDTYYADPVTHEPLSILQMHNIFVNTFLNPGQTIYDWDSLNAHILAIGGMNAPIECHDGYYHYGTYEPVYDWGMTQGYTTCGFMELTERNNFHSQPAPSYSGFGQGMTTTFHIWSDDHTPPYDNSMTKFSNRVRDFYWTLNQASIKAKRGAENSITLEFGNSQPFFKQYSVSIDGGAAAKQAGGAYTWTLHSGTNTVNVSPEDNWGTAGLPSTLSVTY